MIKRSSIVEVMSVLLLITSTISCNKSKAKHFYKFSGITQLVKEYNDVVTLNSVFIVSEQPNWKIYQVLEPQLILKPKKDEKSDTINAELQSVSYRYTFYLIKNGDSSVFEMDSLGSKVKRVFDYSEFKKKLYILNFNNFYDAKSDSLLSVKQKSDTLAATYIPKLKIDLSYPDSTYFFFLTNQKNTSNFSFSRELENQHTGQWLVRVDMIYDSIAPQNASDHGVPRHVMSYSIKDTIVNERALSRLIDVVKEAGKNRHP
jgi:hypothetical protein